ncbi:hypothetical protein LTS08_004551 [Lithohypha guttulata]|nr:hypothetical protein LTS08_004551 [Lithohypha guttulata]
MFSLRVALLLAVALFQIGSSQETPSQVVERIRNANNFPALGIAQLEAETTAIAVSGVRKYGAEARVETSDPWHLGSLTKSMTATILASYIGEGLLTWNTTLAQALPELRDIMHPEHNNTTLEMLTAQYSGIISSQQSNRTFLLESLYQPSFERRVEAVRRELAIPPKYQPNTIYLYDNFNYVIAGLVMEIRTKKTYPEIIQERLFTPLGMTGCGLGPLPETSNSSIDSPWPHYRLNDTEQTPFPLEGYDLATRDNPPFYDPAGRAHCPLDSYLRYLQLHVNGSIPGSTLPAPYSTLTPADFAFLHTPYVLSPSYPSQNTYSYTPGGWLSRLSNPQLFFHDGTNTFNYGYAFVLASGNASSSGAGAVMTNIGLDIDGDATVASAMRGIMDSIVEGDTSILGGAGENGTAPVVSGGARRIGAMYPALSITGSCTLVAGLVALLT